MWLWHLWKGKMTFNKVGVGSQTWEFLEDKDLNECRWKNVQETLVSRVINSI